MALEFSNVIQAACTVVTAGMTASANPGTSAGCVSPDSLPNNPNPNANTALPVAQGVNSVRKINTGKYMIELAQPCGANEAIAIVTTGDTVDPTGTTTGVGPLPCAWAMPAAGTYAGYATPPTGSNALNQNYFREVEFGSAQAPVDPTSFSFLLVRMPQVG